jgi:nucleoside-diphosphate-sugar epimerase
VVLVDDVAAALALLVLHQGDDLDGKALNLAARPDLSAAQLVAELRRVSGRPLVFHPRSYTRMGAAQLGRWALKTGVRRALQPVPSLRDARSMEHYPVIRSDRARQVLGWKPVEDREPFLDAAVRWRAS